MCAGGQRNMADSETSSSPAHPDNSPSEPRREKTVTVRGRRSRRPHIGKSTVALLVLVVLAIVIAIAWIAPRHAAGSARRAPAQRATVGAARAHKGTIDLYLTGLGSVTPLNTITVKTRIDGQLVAVEYHEGQTVHKGAPLVEIDPRPYEAQLGQAEAQLAKDQAAFLNAQTDLKRYQSLIAKNAIAQQTLATQQATVAQDEGAIKADQANIENARLNISYCHITAPIAGRVGLRLVDPGNLVSAAAATPLVVITQMRPISVIFTIPEQKLSDVLTPTRAGKRLRVEAFDSTMENQLATGELTTIDNQVDPTTGTVKLRATLPNEDEALFPNQFVNARVLVDRHDNVTLVPNAAVQRNGSNTFVYVVRPDDTVTLRKVALGAVDASESEIRSGVSAGEIVVTRGTDRLQEGTHVVPQPEDGSPVTPGDGVGSDPAPTVGHSQ
jgi:membrane fusion protein, multidrug efflux system